MLSRSNYALHRKELLALMNQLRAVGAQGELDLPRITVIGNQSAGKSSVVEAISGIKVPRDAGTCTRCPMECRLSSSSKPWSCRISIRLEFDEGGNPLSEVSEHHFCDVDQKDEVELALRRAQYTVLNPDANINAILNMDAAQLKAGLPDRSLLFSRNVVCVDLEGPDLTDLMFLDLPGLIQNAERSVVDLVEDMVKSHIGGNCLILVALPMSDDIENQKALRLAREQDPEGRRTIGVLTKPDMLKEGSKATALWLDVIEGRKHPLQHGYYCTRQPDDEERSKNVTTADLRNAEAQFFKTGAPWSSSTHQNRFGMDNLIQTLSTLLVQIISDKLPYIRQMATERMEACRGELATLGEKAVGEPATHMLNLVTEFAAQVRQYVDGDGQGDTTGLIHERNAAFRQFRAAIRDTQPRFIARLPGQAGIPIDLDGGIVKGNAVEMVAAGQDVYLSDVRAHIAKSITRELPGNIPFSAKKSLILAFQQTWLKHVAACFDHVKGAMLTLLMRCVDERFGRYSNLVNKLKESVTELASKCFETCGTFLTAMLEVEQMPFTQNDHYLQASTEKWASRYKDERAGKSRTSGGTLDEPANKRRRLAGTPAPSGFVASSSNAGNAELFKFGGSATTSSNHFEANAASGSKSTVNGSGSSPFEVDREIAPLPNTQRKKKNREREREQDHDIAMAGPSSISAPAANGGPTDAERMNHILAELAELGYTGLTPDHFGKLRAGDVYETEITVMAETRGYFQCAYKRIIDNIPSLIDAKFLRAIAESLQRELISAFQLGGEKANAICSVYLAEDPWLVARREELVARRKRLEAVQLQLHNFGLGRA
ncbi:P-loop containing nucleoside triphosphate hydrolase protein [Mycena amicta]|nr:P-loop containing nucleoside triphosphate hydrolase protein [Mycena amicta]